MVDTQRSDVHVGLRVLSKWILAGGFTFAVMAEDFSFDDFNFVALSSIDFGTIFTPPLSTSFSIGLCVAHTYNYMRTVSVFGDRRKERRCQPVGGSGVLSFDFRLTDFIVLRVVYKERYY